MLGEGWRWSAWRQAMPERGMSQPWTWFMGAAEIKLGAHKAAERRQQRPHGVTQRAGVLPIGVGVDDLQRVEGRVADLDAEHRQAEQDEYHANPPPHTIPRREEARLPCKLVL